MSKIVSANSHRKSGLIVVGVVVVALTTLATWVVRAPLAQAGTIEGVESVSSPDAGCSTMAQRIQAKDVVIDQLLAGEITLKQAATSFGELNVNHVAFQEQYSGRDDQEKLCRQVIRWVKARSKVQGPDSDLEKQLQQLEEQLTASQGKASS
ncbi:MAG: hypothetical protein U0840_00395 [Gemmataceae bacterium]